MRHHITARWTFDEQWAPEQRCIPEATPARKQAAGMETPDFTLLDELFK